MQRRWLTGTLVACAIALAGAACGDSGGQAPTSPSATGGTAATGQTATGSHLAPGGSMPTSIGAGEGHLNLVVRPGYAGAAWVGAFQEETGCIVTAEVATTSDRMVELMHTGRYDGIAAPADASTRLILAGDAAPVNVDLIRSYPDLSGFLKDQPSNTYEGTHYGIPNAWGATLLLWRPDVVQPDPDSWSLLFDPASPYRGRLAAHDDPMAIADAALYLRSARPELDITDVYELTREQFTAAVDAAQAQHGLVGQYWADDAQLIAAAVAGRVVIGTGSQLAANRITADPAGGGPVKAIVPREGTTGWTDAWMVYSKARNPNCMYLWMDFITRPAVQAQVATAVGEAPANPKACGEIAKTDPAFCDAFHVGDGAFASTVAFRRLPLADCGDARGATCTGYDAWVQAWRKIRG
jgi:putative spermidine/putrescine transport system substrate-binding protein